MKLDKEREVFEGWFAKEFRVDEWKYQPFSRIEFNDIDAYSCSTVDIAWSAWQAAKDNVVPDGFKVVPINYECAWCGCTELDGWTDETEIEP